MDKGDSGNVLVVREHVYVVSSNVCPPVCLNVSQKALDIMLFTEDYVD